jgi:hypothetical protein
MNSLFCVIHHVHHPSCNALHSPKPVAHPPTNRSVLRDDDVHPRGRVRVRVHHELHGALDAHHRGAQEEQGGVGVQQQARRDALAAAKTADVSRGGSAVA